MVTGNDSVLLQAPQAVLHCCPRQSKLARERRYRGTRVGRSSAISSSSLAVKVIFMSSKYRKFCRFDGPAPQRTPFFPEDRQGGTGQCGTSHSWWQAATAKDLDAIDVVRVKGGARMLRKSQAAADSDFSSVSFCTGPESLPFAS